MVKFIPVDLTLPLRSEILRNGRPFSECKFPTDQIAGIFHLGFYLKEEIVSIASFFPNNYKNNKVSGYQLRGMATDQAHLGMGYGKQIIKFAVEYIKNTNAQYIWCNARTSAIEFYQRIGFELISAEFEIPDVGPHYEMILKLN